MDCVVLTEGHSFTKYLRNFQGYFWLSDFYCKYFRIQLSYLSALAPHLQTHTQYKMRHHLALNWALWGSWRSLRWRLWCTGRISDLLVLIASRQAISRTRSQDNFILELRELCLIFIGKNDKIYIHFVRKNVILSINIHIKSHCEIPKTDSCSIYGRAQWWIYCMNIISSF